MKFSKFSIVTDTTPSEQITSEQLIDEIRSEQHKQLCDEIRRAPDKDTRTELKKLLPAVTASGTFSKRAAGALLKHSGLLVCDLDLDDNPQLIEHCDLLKDRLREDAHVAFFFTSPSGGLKVALRVSANDMQTHASAFLSAQEYMREQHGVIIDKACKDVSRLCFLSHDEGAYINKRAKPIETTAKAADVPFWAPVASKPRDLGDSPGDQFDKRGDVEGMLRSQGWSTSDGKYWTRPGKQSGISGTFGIVGERKFYCWTSNASPLEANESYSPFGLFATFYHGGDFKAAATDLASQGFGEDSLPEVTPQMQKCIESLIKQHDESYKSMEKELAKTQEELEAVRSMTVLDLLKSRDISNAAKLAERKKLAKEMVFVLPGIAARGQATAIYASPNSGKTLITMSLLKEQAEKNALGDLTVIYCNFDDDFIGANMKGEFMEPHPEIVMIDNQDQTPEEVLKMMQVSIEDGSASSMCFILDTLIRFVSDSDKKTQREFTSLVQRFVGAQGTVIGLGHTNKHKDGEGKSIHGGTSDIRNSFSQSAILELQTDKEATQRVVKFYNDKLRGMAKLSTCFQYDHGDSKNWVERVATVKRVDEKKADSMHEALLANHQWEQDQPIIEYIKTQLSSGAQSITDLTQNNLVDFPGSKAERIAVIERYCEGVNKQGRELWAKSKSQTRGYNLYLIDEQESEKTVPIWGGFG